MGEYITKGLVAVLIVVLMAATIMAKDILITNDTGTQRKGNLLLEINNMISSDSELVAGINSEQKVIALESIVSYGYLDNIDFILALPYVWYEVRENNQITQKVNGASDFSAELKYKFYEADTLSFAVKPAISIPVGDEEKGLGAGKVGYNVFFIATTQIRPVSFNLNLAYFRNENNLLERENIWYASLSTEYAARENMLFIFNAGIGRNPEKGSYSLPTFMLAGVNYSVTDRFDINGGVKKGLNEAETDITFLAGIAVKL